ncbi:serine hydrolase domain-containing protein [Paenibacillus sp. KN14-4R]|uniref:serine hydrolase domain-containing protein n=1 Tax=Paenibacillus sp. KN14-4R TaxID=3445773 RepID=UPI003FA0849A
MKMNLNIVDRMAHHNVTGLSIVLIDHGQICVTEGWGNLEAGTPIKVSPHSIFNACSMSKFVTSMLVMHLVELGILDLDEDVNQKLVSWKIPDHPFMQSTRVTLRHLLSHQAGIIDPEGSYGEITSTQGTPTLVQLLQGTTVYCTEAIRVQYEPGSEFHYSDAGFCIIQQLIEDVCKKPFEVVMHELVFDPLHMESSAYLLAIPQAISEHFACGHDKYGNIVGSKYPIYPFPAAAGLWTTPSDIAKLVLTFMSALKGKNNWGLSQRMAKEMMTPQGCKEWTGLGLFLNTVEQDIQISSLGWGVGFQCMMVAYPDLESGAIIMTNTDLGVHQLKGIIGEVFDSLSFRL